MKNRSCSVGIFRISCLGVVLVRVLVGRLELPIDLAGCKLRS